MLRYERLDMKSKTMILVLLVLLAVTGAGRAIAAARMYVCDVIRAGVNDQTGKTEIVLKPQTQK